MLSGITGQVSVADLVLGIPGKMVGSGHDNGNRSGSGHHRIMVRTMLAVLIDISLSCFPLLGRIHERLVTSCTADCSRINPKRTILFDFDAHRISTILYIPD